MRPETLFDHRLASLEMLIAQVVQHMNEWLGRKFVAILLTGAAARDEVTFDPDGSLLSDLDFLVVLPQRYVVTAVLQEYWCRQQLRGLPPEIRENVSIGFASAVPRYWRMATPLMWELKMNGRVLLGSDQVKMWPLISRADQIPHWEGIRLIANRLCELLSILGKCGDTSLDNLSHLAVRRLQYASLKMILACSEACLIRAQCYQASYFKRYQHHVSLASGFTAEQNAYIEMAYQAKLGSGASFYESNIEFLIEVTLDLVIMTLSRLGLSAPEVLEQHVYIERNVAPGIAVDMLFWLSQQLAGKSVPFRRAIASVYRDAFSLCLEVVDQRRINGNNSVFSTACRDLTRRFKETPQMVSILPATKIPRGFHA